MKPTCITVDNASRRDSFDPIMRKGCRSPITDSNYHSVPLGHSGAKYASTSAHSFWNIAGDYFKNEAHSEFLGEAALFAVIVVTAILPLLSNAHALMEFIRVISGY
jgi:hypothetical protein